MVCDSQDHTVHRLILGTCTSDQQNRLLTACVQIRKECTAKDSAEYGSERGDNFIFSNKIFLSITTNFFSELADFGLYNAKINIKLKINHDGEFNRARYMPQNSSFIATKSPSADVIIFNYTKLATQNIDSRPELRLRGHTKEDYGLSWNPNINRHTLSASDDHTICLWDLFHETIFVSVGDDHKLMM